MRRRTSDRRDMNKLTNHIRAAVAVLAFIICHLSLTPAGAQTFTQRLQARGGAGGDITIHHSDSIDRLVNSAMLSSASAPGATRPASPAPARKAPAAKTGPAAKTEQASQAAAEKRGQATAEKTSPLSDTADQEESTQKVLRGGHKINGYRVQAFAGGNSRNDRRKAEQTGSAIKALYPDVPIYVHFHSPRWICRVGNYRTYEEAHQMLVSLRSIGYDQATIVKGKITVTD